MKAQVLTVMVAASGIPLPTQNLNTYALLPSLLTRSGLFAPSAVGALPHRLLTRFTLTRPGGVQPR